MRIQSVGHERRQKINGKLVVKRRGSRKTGRKEQDKKDESLWSESEKVGGNECRVGGGGERSEGGMEKRL